MGWSKVGAPRRPTPISAPGVAVKNLNNISFDRYNSSGGGGMTLLEG